MKVWIFLPLSYFRNINLEKKKKATKHYRKETNTEEVRLIISEKK